MSKNQNTKKPAAKNAAGAKTAAPANVIDVKETAKIAAILTAICLVIALALAGTNMLTEDIIAKAAAEAKAATCFEVIPAEEYCYLSDELEGYDDYDVYLAVHGGRVIGAAVTTVSKGYGGDVQVMTGIDENGCVTGVSILSHSETAGLGANAAKPSFLDQFITGADQPAPDSFAVVKDGGEIDAVTAATISSRAVSNAVNEALGIHAQLRADGVIGMQIFENTGAPASGTDLEPVSGADAPAGTITEGGEDIG